MANAVKYLFVVDFIDLRVKMIRFNKLNKIMKSKVMFQEFPLSQTSAYKANT